ncbi:unnamed protein product [Phytophthora fragariaefolia]|uniref:Unnamed protein product n=1 Tax=Phytophthora fragariaefolia TaxID=1490495 RepID=A0A9W6X6F0_9STRA|nr:unnamed protein product [Phytophthora fragariaefolia]
MMNLQADMEAILDQFNLADLVFQHEQHRLVYEQDVQARGGAVLLLGDSANEGIHDVGACSASVIWTAGTVSTSQPRSGSGGRGGNGDRGANTSRGAGGDNTPTRGAHSSSSVSMNKFDEVTAGDSVLTAGEDHGTIEAAVDGVPVKALLIGSDADTLPASSTRLARLANQSLFKLLILYA